MPILSPPRSLAHRIPARPPYPAWEPRPRSYSCHGEPISTSVRSSIGSCHERYTRNTGEEETDTRAATEVENATLLGVQATVRMPTAEQQANLNYPFRHSRRLVSAAGSYFFSWGHLDTPQQQGNAPASPRRVVCVRWTTQSLPVEVSAMQPRRYQV